MKRSIILKIRNKSEDIKTQEFMLNKTEVFDMKNLKRHSEEVNDTENK